MDVFEVNPVDAFLEHHGVKGMQWRVNKVGNLDRIFRMAAGTQVKKIQKNKNDQKAKNEQKAKEKELALAEKKKTAVEIPTTSSFLAKHSGLKLSDIRIPQPQNQMDNQEGGD